MSSTELIEFHNGIADNSYEFKNSWGGAARIWDSLFKAYIPKEQEYDSRTGEPKTWTIKFKNGAEEKAEPLHRNFASV